MFCVNNIYIKLLPTIEQGEVNFNVNVESIIG